MGVATAGSTVVALGMIVWCWIDPEIRFFVSQYFLAKHNRQAPLFDGRCRLVEDQSVFKRFPDLLHEITECCYFLAADSVFRGSCHVKR